MHSLPRPIALGRTAEVYTWEDGKVLKLFHDWVSSRSIEEEHRLSLLVQASGLPVPAVYDILAVNGRRGIVFERVEGISMLEAMGRSPAQSSHYLHMLGQLHFRMHTFSAPTLPSLRERLHWKIEHAEPLPAEMKAAVLHLLASLPDGDSLCHGDFHPGNIILTSAGPIIIDWCDAARGDPLADVARTRLLVTTARLPGISSFAMLLRVARRWMLDQYLDGYFPSDRDARHALHTWMPVVAAARLEEGISHETPLLLRLVALGLRNLQRER